MIIIPAGDFVMGCDDGLVHEKPAHSVYLDEFAIDQYPVTNAQFKEFIKACPSWQKDAGVQRYLNTYYLYTWRKGLIYPKGKRDHPAVYMNWYAAAAYCNWRSHRDGYTPCYDEENDFACDFSANGYRLPSEAEFEKAARGGETGTLYPWGHDIDKTKANYDNIIGDTSEVGAYPPNGFNLYDMGGNIGHWCQDWFDPNCYQNRNQKNPSGPKKGTHRAYRGGSWGNPKEYQRVACRFWMLPENTNPDFGFRCVRKV